MKMPELLRISGNAASRLQLGAWSRESLDEIARELSSCIMNDADHAAFERLRAAPSADPWRELEILDHPGMHASLFYLPQGAVIPLHDHPSMTVISKVLVGRLRMRTLLWLDPAQGLARDEGEKELDAADPALVMAQRAGVLHEIRALAECIFFDLFSPYYAEEEGRDCSYYQMEGGPQGAVKLTRRSGALIS